jgi:hypothetical protein
VCIVHSIYSEISKIVVVAVAIAVAVALRLALTLVALPISIPLPLPLPLPPYLRIVPLYGVLPYVYVLGARALLYDVLRVSAARAQGQQRAAGGRVAARHAPEGILALPHRLDDPNALGGRPRQHLAAIVDLVYIINR